jgi:hypothetical protein
MERMAGIKHGGVVDWQWLMREMPIGSDDLSKRERHLLWESQDCDGSGLLHISEVVKGFLNMIRVVRGMMDLKPICTSCFKLAREAVDPVIPIGIDFMERNQFRMFLVCLWMYFRLWEYFYRACPKGCVAVKMHNLPEVVKILQDFGYPDAHRFHTFAMRSFQDVDSELAFDKFAELCIQHVLPELSGIDGEYEKNYARKKIGSRHPALLSKPAEVGSYKAQSMESLEKRLTGFNYKKTLAMKKTASDPSLLQPKPTNSNNSKQWTSQYEMQFTNTKFFPKARSDPYSHPCKTERDLPISHPYYQIHKQLLSPSTSASCGGPPMQPDIGRLLPVTMTRQPRAPLKVAGLTMAQKLQHLGVGQRECNALQRFAGLH